MNLHHGDCLHVLKGLPDNSVDSIVTDPPYALTDGKTESFSNRLGRVFLDVVLPDLYNANVATGRLSEFCGPFDSVTFLNFMNRSIGEKTRVAVPEGAVDLKSYSIGNQEVKDARECAIRVSDGVLPDIFDSETVQNNSHFILQLGASGDTAIRDSSCRLFRKLDTGRFCVPVIIPFDSGFSGFLSTLKPVFPSFIADVVRLFDYPKRESSGPSGVMAGSGTEIRAMLSFDLRRGLIEILPADSADAFDLFFFLRCAEPIRAISGACGLPPKFEPCTFSFIGDTTNRAITIHFHKEILRSLHYSRKGFMGKDWDSELPSVDVWRECLRVLKPGGHLLSFAGSRTYHRMTVAIEDAGFEIRDQIMWVYGCLSDDSEVLTRDGWERYNTARHKEILAYDAKNDVYQWEKPTRWNEYRVESDTAYRIKSDQTDQIVSRGHRCLVERGGALAFVSADELAGMERVPYLQDDVFTLPQGCGELLLADVLRQGKGLAEATLSKRQRQEVSSQGVGWPEESGVEGGVNVLQTEGQVRRPADQVRPLPCEVRGDGSQGRLRHGASSACGAGTGPTAVAERVRASHQPRRDGQPAGEPDAVRIECGSQAVRTRPSYRTTLATVTPVEYTGLIFCPTVSTGAFVARRNGKVFITGNSGFPKSLDVSKAIDKAAGAEREVVGLGQYANRGRVASGSQVDVGDSAASLMTAPATPAAEQWEGWGTALKPAHEPICVARKPLVGTVAENVQAHGTGALNIDACRVEGAEPTERGNRRNSSADPDGLGGGTFGIRARTVDEKVRHSGRWPANLIHDGSDEVVAGFPVTGAAKSGVRDPNGSMGYHGGASGLPGVVSGYDDNGGSAARFFFRAEHEKEDLLFCRAKAILTAWKLTKGVQPCSQENASVAESSLCLSRQAVVSVLSDAVIAASRGDRLLSDARGLSTTATESECERLCETLITAMLISESVALPAPSQDVLIQNGCRVNVAAIQKPTDTMTITISLPKSGGYAEHVTFSIMPSSMAHGVKGLNDRFRYCAKASKRDRNEGCEHIEPKQYSHDGRETPIENAYQRNGSSSNSHPTVKPTDLMRYLCRLVTPPGGVVLDPFMGSGSTGKAAVLEGFRFIGIEREAEYLEIARARIRGAA